MKSSSLAILVIAGLLFCTGIVLIGVGSSFFVKSNSESSAGHPAKPTCDPEECNGDKDPTIDVQFDKEDLRIKYVRNENKQNVLTIYMGMNPNGDGPLPYNRQLSQCNDTNPVCSEVTYDIGAEQASLSMTVRKFKDGAGVACYETTWIGNSDVIAPTDCIQMSDYWFGGPEMYYQDWPINGWEKNMSFYLSGDMFEDPQQYGSVLERYWLSSQGVALWVPPSNPLHVSMEKQQICLKGKYEYPYRIRGERYPYHWLQYTTCFANSPQVVHEFLFSTVFSRPTGLPDLRMMKSPIWSTWARYKIFINQSVVLDYANEILRYNFSNSQLEIDDGYELHYGDHTFNTRKFPNASEMIDTLHQLGFRVTTWVTPFINPRSENYQNGSANKYFILDGDTDESGLVGWWNGRGYSIDYTNDEACDWYMSLLKKIRKTYGVDSFKFDAGEINYVTAVGNYKIYKETENLGFYTKKYAECAHSFGNQIEIRAAWSNQLLPIFVRMMDKESNWSRAKGLKTLIPTALTFSLIGYPYILPDMIGGNSYEEGFRGTPLPERELFIRWLELTAFLPSMQFSHVPWQYDNETVEIAKKFVDLHETVVYDELVAASNEYMTYKASMGPIRPIWWVTVDDSRAFAVDDEFMVGDRYLVAPIVDNATRFRDIYLPGPFWRNGDKKLLWVHKMNKKGPVLGGTTVYDYHIELDEISWWEMTFK